MSEKKVEELFLNYKNQFIELFGNRALYGSQINDAGEKLFGDKWNGYSLQNENGYASKLGYHIINTDTLRKDGSGGEGIHWVALVITPKIAYVFDSYARNPQKILKHLTKKMKNKKVKIVSSDRSDLEQKDTKSELEICGQLSLAWLSVVDQIGIMRALKI